MSAENKPLPKTIYDEKLDLWYTLDEKTQTYLPNLTVPEQPEAPTGRYARMRAKYLKENQEVTYCTLLTSCKLNEHLTEIEQTATEMEERLTKEMAASEGVTEKLKAEDMMSWVRKMNNIKSRVQEIVMKEVIYA